MGGVFNHINGNLYHYAANNPVRYVDPDGREAGYLNDSKSVGGLGHSAMFVEVYNENGESAGFELYEVGSVRLSAGTWVGISPNGNDISNSEVLSHNKLDGKMGVPVGTLVGGSVFSLGSGIGTAVIGVGASELAGTIIESVDRSAGVFVRKYSSYEEMANALENKRYDNVTVFTTTKAQDKLIKNKAFDTGVNFSKYNLFTNNCTQHASNALSAGGIQTKGTLIPNSENAYILKKNNNYSHTSWRE